MSLISVNDDVGAGDYNDNLTYRAPRHEDVTLRMTGISNINILVVPAT
jgi:hypothetical protein